MVGIVHPVNVGHDGVVLRKEVPRLFYRRKIRSRGDGRMTLRLLRFSAFTGTGFDGLDSAKLSGWP